MIVRLSEEDAARLAEVGPRLRALQAATRHAGAQLAAAVAPVAAALRVPAHKAALVTFRDGHR